MFDGEELEDKLYVYVIGISPPHVFSDKPRIYFAMLYTYRKERIILFKCTKNNFNKANF